MKEDTIPAEIKGSIIARLNKLYEHKLSPEFINRFLSLLPEQPGLESSKQKKWTEKDIILITYGDMIKSNNLAPLKTLEKVLTNHLKDEISCVHILPFFPYSSDEGFAVIDYYKVNHALGGWEDIKSINSQFDLMVDLVINHISSHNKWFTNYKADKIPGKEYFIETDPAEDISQVVRPRNLPLLTPVDTVMGLRYVWTTFSPDQVDLNFKNPEVLYEMIRILIFYISKGARIIRLDAIAFLWKQTGTSCIHLWQTHEVVKLIRDVMDYIDPKLILLTETNVPNNENLSYFGDGDEAHMVYLFSLPPLLLFTLFSGNSGYFNTWGKKIRKLDAGKTFFNFTSSHDGIGVRPLEGLLPENKFNELLETMKDFGGLISTRKNNEGFESPYEINITYFDALKGTRKGIDNLQKERFICSQIIMLTMKGIPAFYMHSLLGTHNDLEGVEHTGKPRAINRKRMQYEKLLKNLHADTPESYIFNTLKQLIGIRKRHSIFHPDNPQEIIAYKNHYIIIKREDNRTREILYSISNISSDIQITELSKIIQTPGNYKELIRDKIINSDSEFQMKPYETFWLLK
ncbi:MAG: sugar phosphorylase [Bacteroidales bacterium]|nr:sugar phosphorylase [Bacteroidales bacterium]